MKRRLVPVFAVLVLLPLLMSTVSADMGPKPSVNIEITGISEPCWGTLLSERQSTGPYTSVKNHPEYREEERSRAGEWASADAWDAFSAYEEIEPDGYYFLNFLDDCADGQLNWTYYPPQKFKVALWFPEENSMLVTGPYERYAFDSYYTLDLTNVQPENGKLITGLAMVRSYDMVTELLGLGVRIVLTVLLEIAVAWLFRLRAKGQLRLILGVNIVTQLLLNGFLNWYSYVNGTLFLTAFFLLGEILVLAVEGKIYCRWLPGLGEEGATCYPWVYALCANVLSCAAGLILAHVIPSVF